jgi:hypothetical protein
MGGVEIPAVVRLKADLQNLYILMAGHAYYDIDLGYSNPNTANSLNFEWGGFKIPCEVRTIKPHSESFGAYHRMGDKIGSKFDAALAQIKPGIGWNNIHKHTSLWNADDRITKKLYLLDFKWPPVPDANYIVATNLCSPPGTSAFATVSIVTSVHGRGRSLPSWRGCC